ncbi:MAG: hypothetical protein IKZ82_09510 [Clostridia bacterium]|nr:hypothetical protein [Clostridia bacterium]
MKNRTLIRLAWIHAALCTVLGIVIFLAHLIDSAAKGIVADLRPFLLTFGLIAFAAITASWLRLYKRDRAVRTRSVVGFLSILSVVPTAFLILFLLAGLLRHWRGGLEIAGSESQLAKPSEPAIILEMKGDPEHGGIVEQGFQTSITGQGMEV